MVFNWLSQANIHGSPTVTGESLVHVNIKTCNMPFGQIWVGGTALLSPTKTIVSPITFSVLFNNLVVKSGLPTEDIAISAAQDWYNVTAAQVIQQAEQVDLDAKIDSESKQVVSESVENENS
jgi:hypothetical protein